MFPVIKLFGQELFLYTVFQLLAIGAGAWILRTELRRHAYPRRTFPVLLLAGSISGWAGAKLYYLTSQWESVLSNPALLFSRGTGSGWYGGLLIGFICIVITLRIMKLPVLKALDHAVPALPAAQFFGRTGCFLAGCCLGRPSSVPWAMAFPDGVIPTYVRVHPTQLYEMLIFLAAFFLLWGLRRRSLPAGSRLGLYLVILGTGRFVVEFFRINPVVFWGLTLPQLWAFFWSAAGVVLMLAIEKKPKNFRISGG